MMAAVTAFLKRVTDSLIQDMTNTNGSNHTWQTVFCSFYLSTILHSFIFCNQCLMFHLYRLKKYFQIYFLNTNKSTQNVFITRTCRWKYFLLDNFASSDTSDYFSQVGKNYMVKLLAKNTVFPLLATDLCLACLLTVQPEGKLHPLLLPQLCHFSKMNSTLYDFTKGTSNDYVPCTDVLWALQVQHSPGSAPTCTSRVLAAASL